jgi:hypothetical protein
MTYLLEFQGLDLFRPFIVKIPGTGSWELGSKQAKTLMYNFIFQMPHW